MIATPTLISSFMLSLDHGHTIHTPGKYPYFINIEGSTLHSPMSDAYIQVNWIIKPFMAVYPLVCPITMENHHFEWINQVFLWPFSVAMFNYPEGKLQQFIKPK